MGECNNILDPFYELLKEKIITHFLSFLERKPY